MIHELKIEPRWFLDVASGKKNFEIRRYDRDFREGDTLILKEWQRGKFTGRQIIKTIQYVYEGDGTYGIADEYCVLGIAPGTDSEAKGMKPLEELQATPHLAIEGRVAVGAASYEAEVYNGWIDFGNGRFKGTVLFGYKEAGWEHVSVSHFNRRKLPTWEDMCLIKEMFWGKNVTVCQFHPAEEAYIHSIGTSANKLENVLHLWRPINGDWSVITEEMMRYL